MEEGRIVSSRLDNTEIQWQYFPATNQVRITASEDNSGNPLGQGVMMQVLCYVFAADGLVAKALGFSADEDDEEIAENIKWIGKYACMGMQGIAALATTHGLSTAGLVTASASTIIAMALIHKDPQKMAAAAAKSAISASMDQPELDRMNEKFGVNHHKALEGLMKVVEGKDYDGKGMEAMDEVVGRKPEVGTVRINPEWGV